MSRSQRENPHQDFIATINRLSDTPHESLIYSKLMGAIKEFQTKCEDINEQDEYDGSLLHHIINNVTQENKEVSLAAIALLQTNELDFNLIDADGYTPLLLTIHQILEFPEQEDELLMIETMLQILNNKSVDINASPPNMLQFLDYMSALIDTRYTEVICCFLNTLVDSNILFQARCLDDNTILHALASQDKPSSHLEELSANIFSTLEATGQQVFANKRNEAGKTALHIAADANNIWLMELLLLQENISINPQDIFRKTPLQYATSKEDPSPRAIVTLLDYPGCDPTITDNREWNPLHSLAKSNSLPAVKLF